MLVFVIKQLRLEKNISLNYLSKQTGISRAYLFDLENNRKFNPTLEILYKISSALNINVKDLFYTELDIDNLRNIMYDRIDEYGISSDKVLEVSQIIDLLLNIEGTIKNTGN